MRGEGRVCGEGHKEEGRRHLGPQKRHCQLRRGVGVLR